MSWLENIWYHAAVFVWRFGPELFACFVLCVVLLLVDVFLAGRRLRNCMEIELEEKQ